MTIVNKNGLHARPAAEIVKIAAKFQSDDHDRARRSRGERQEHHGRDDARGRMRFDDHASRARARRDGGARRARDAHRRQVRGEVAAPWTRLRRHSRVTGHRRRPRAPPALGGARRAAPHHPRRRDPAEIERLHEAFTPRQGAPAASARPRRAARRARRKRRSSTCSARSSTTRELIAGSKA